MTNGTKPSRTLRFLAGVRDFWLILGIALVVLFALEGIYRAQQAIRVRLGAKPDSSAFPYHDTPWFKALQADVAKSDSRFDPYRGYWPIPLHTRYVNIDSSGHRLTVNPPSVNAAHPMRRLYMMGGSTMWSLTARDSATISSLVSQRLTELGITDVQVTSLAQRGFNSTQEFNTLIQEVSRGRKPDFAVFLTGYNDIATAHAFGNDPGHTYIERQTQQILDRGRAGFGGRVVSLGDDSELIQRLLRLVQGRPSSGPAVKRDCTKSAVYFRNIVELDALVGREHGFETFFFLQPVASSSKKPRTKWERAMGMKEDLVECFASYDSVMRARPGLNYTSLTGLFDQDTAAVFLDEPHITEDGNRLIANEIVAVILPRLRLTEGAGAPKARR